MSRASDDQRKQDAERLAWLLRENREQSIRLEATRDSQTKRELRGEISQLRRAILTLVDRWFREALRPIVADRFRDKGLQAAPSGQEVYSNDKQARWTDYLNDFFLEVLSKFDDPFWQKQSAIELRNYASWAISNDIRDQLRRQKKQSAIGDDAVRDKFESQLAADVEQRFVADDFDVEVIPDAMEIIDAWADSDDQRLSQTGIALRHRFVSDMKLKDIASDLGIPLPTAAGRIYAGLVELRKQLLQLV